MPIELNLAPTKNELRWFGGLLAAFVAAVGGVVRWQLEAPDAALAIWCTGGVLVAAYAVAPALLRPVYIGLLRTTYPVGWLLSHGVLAAAYFLVLTPIGLVLRLVKGDPLERAIDRSRPSYWTKRGPKAEVRRYFRQF